MVLSVNAHTPALHVNGSLLVPFDGFAPLLPTLLQVKDPDSPSEQLIFQLVQKPSNGRLVLFRGEEGEETGGREIKKDDTFTWAELRHGRVRFQYQRDKDRSVRWTKLFLYFAWNNFLRHEFDTILGRIQSQSYYTYTCLTIIYEFLGGRHCFAKVCNFVTPSMYSKNLT